MSSSGKIDLTLILTLLTMFCVHEQSHAQVAKYLFRFDDNYRLDRVEALGDSSSLFAKDTLWWGQEEKLLITTETLRNTWVSYGDVHMFYQEGMIDWRKDSSLARIRMTHEFRQVFEDAMSIHKWWMQTYYTSKRRKRTDNVKHLLQTDNAIVVSNALGRQSKSLNLALDAWVWQLKMHWFLNDWARHPAFLEGYHSTVDSLTQARIAAGLFIAMRLPNQMQLIGSDPRTLIDQCEMEIREHPGKPYYVFKYAALLYNISTMLDLSIGLADDERIQNIQVDTALLYYPGTPELDHVRRLIRDSEQSMNLAGKVFISETQQSSLRELIAKDLVVIDFWATWCKPCLENMPRIKELSIELDESVQFIAIAVDKMKPWSKFVKEKEHGTITMALIDGESTTVYSLGVKLFPTYLVINQSGEILHGPVHSVNDLEKALNMARGK